MKILIIISLLTLSVTITSCIKENEQTIKPIVKDKGTVFITRTKVGFNIYSNRGELLLEYTKRNCDSLSLQTLDDIYETAKEFYYRERFQDESEIKPSTSS